MSDTEQTASNDSELQVEILPTSDGNSDIQSAVPVIPDTGFIPLQNFLGISHPDDEQTEKLQYIWDEVGKGRSREETLEKIKEYRHRIAPPALGENELHVLYSYVRLVGEARSIDRERKAYEKQ